MIINERTITTWSKIGSRATFGLAMLEIGKPIENLIVLTADTSTSAGLDRFKKAMPDRFLDIGIAEQNMIGVAAGFASEGFTVVTATFAPFQTMRCCEQIRVNLGYMKHKVTMVGLASGVVLGPLGYTHCCIEDVAVMRSVPGISVVSPADCTETAKAVEAAVHSGNSIYVRLTGGKDNPPVYSQDYAFELGRGIQLMEGHDIAIIANGTMVHRSLEAAKILVEQGISTSVINMHTVKPLDCALVEKAFRTHKLVVTVEEHSIIGGLGSAVAEHAATLGSGVRQVFMGLGTEFGKSGDYEDILAHHALTPAGIAACAQSNYGAVKNTAA